MATTKTALAVGVLESIGTVNVMVGNVGVARIANMSGCNL